MKKLDNEKIKAIFSSDKARIVFVFVGLAAILLIFISSKIPYNNAKDNTSDLSTSAYCSTLTSELTNMIESIEKAGETQVLLTLESSYEYVYLDDDKTLAKILEPKIRGVAVACTGGDDPVVIEKITKLLSTVLSVSTSSISVSKLI